jgi:NAD(P)H-dependent flavin oxidoreductase YrpB (nitropropane dioxygenase family)
MSALIELHLSYHCEGDRASEFQVFGWRLARSHAKAGDTATISRYLGNSDQFDEAIDGFSLAYGDQAQRDHTALKAAARKGAITADQEA